MEELAGTPFLGLEAQYPGDPLWAPPWWAAGERPVRRPRWALAGLFSSGISDMADNVSQAHDQAATRLVRLVIVERRRRQRNRLLSILGNCAWKRRPPRRA
jgi:hypothetical protein